MNVLVWKPDSSTPFGGHLVQMEMTSRYLAEAGVSVRVCEHDHPDWEGVDVVHGMGLRAWHVREARRRRLPVCLSVIYSTVAYRVGLLRQERPGQTLIRRTRTAGVLALAAARGVHTAKCEAYSEFALTTKALYEAADVLLPNSDLEAQAIRDELRVTTPMRVIPNAADPSLFPLGPPWDERQGVLYVGRIEPHKNQLSLIRALRGTGIALTLVGGDHRDHPRYASEVRAEADRGNVRLAGQVPHNELARFYEEARVHALPSHFETTGLVSLEAGLAGCNVVSTSVGFAREYFADLAWYCDPYDLGSIRSSVLEALASPPRPELRKRILDRYTWQHTAASTIDAYRDAVERRL